MDRELKEAARQRRLKELEEKRYAWSAGEDQNSVFGRSSSENDVEMLTKEGLLDFFQKRSQSPHNSLGRSASARRHRHTVTSTADRELQGYLELFGSTGTPTDYYKFNSLPRSGRAVQRRTSPWILDQDGSRELGCHRQVTSPHAETEPISPLARFSSSGQNDEDPYNNNYSSVSESSVLPRSFCVFQKSTHLKHPNSTVTGHMNVSVEKHTLVRGPQAFDLPSPNNNSNHMQFFNQGDVVVTELEKERQSLPKNLDGCQNDNTLEKRADRKAEWEGKVQSPFQMGVSSEKEKEEDDCSTVSSTTCDTPLPLDTSGSSKKPVFYTLDCTETDCSVTLDYSEADTSSLTKEGVHFRTDRSKDQEIQLDLSSLSSNLESMSPNDMSVSVSEFSESKSVGAESTAQSANTEEWDTESCDTAEGKQAVEKDAQRNSKKPAHSKNNKVTKSSGGRGVRTLTTSESQGMRKVVPISKLNRTGSSKRAERPLDSGETRRPFRDQSTPARGRSDKTARPPRHSSLPPEESKVQRPGGVTGSISRWARDSMPRKASIHKPNAKPLRNIAKPVPEEKICRSTMRALAQVQTQAGAPSDNSSSQAHSVKNSSSDIPSFARNTVSSTSRTRKELSLPSVPSTPSRSPSLLGRHSSAKQSRVSPTVHTSEEKPQGTNLRRVQSVKVTHRSTYRSETPPPPTPRDDVRKTSSFSEKSTMPKDLLTSGRITKPSWK